MYRTLVLKVLNNLRGYGTKSVYDWSPSLWIQHICSVSETAMIFSNKELTV